MLDKCCQRKAEFRRKLIKMKYYRLNTCACNCQNKNQGRIRTIRVCTSYSEHVVIRLILYSMQSHVLDYTSGDVSYEHYTTLLSIFVLLQTLSIDLKISVHEKLKYC